MQQQKASRQNRTRRSSAIFGGLLPAILLLAGAVPAARAQTYQVIYNFTDIGSDGADPYGGPILDAQGNLFGTTYLGGKYGNGAVYELTPNGGSWAYSTIYSLKNEPDGAGPAFASLALGADHALYGVTEGGGYFGTAFTVCPCAPRETVIHSFGFGSDGAEPIGGLVFDSQGNLYGTTLVGGDNGNGTVYALQRPASGQLDQRWTEGVIYRFAGGNDAINPAAGVSVDAKGNLYGTTSFGGVNGVGAVYMLTRFGSQWTESVLYSFQGLDDGANPIGGVILDAAGNLYGTTFDSGVNGGGTIYEMSPSNGGWTFNVLYSFVGGYGGPYNKLTFDASGSLYGVTNSDGANGLGEVFKLSPGNSGWTLTDLHDFSGEMMATFRMAAWLWMPTGMSLARLRLAGRVVRE